MRCVEKWDVSNSIHKYVDIPWNKQGLCKSIYNLVAFREDTCHILPASATICSHLWYSIAIPAIPYIPYCIYNILMCANRFAEILCFEIMHDNVWLSIRAIVIIYTVIIYTVIIYTVIIVIYICGLRSVISILWSTWLIIIINMFDHICKHMIILNGYCLLDVAPTSNGQSFGWEEPY